MSRILLDYAANPNATDLHAATALHTAAMRGNERIVKLLLKSRADIFLKENDGNTPLHYAIAGANGR